MSELPCPSQQSSSLGCCSPCTSVDLHGEASGTGALSSDWGTWAVIGNWPVPCAISILPSHLVSAVSRHMCVTHGRFQASHSPHVTLTRPPANQGDLSSWCWIPWLGSPNVAQTTYSAERTSAHCPCNPPLLSIIPGAQISTWWCLFPLLPNSMWKFLTGLVV